MNGSLGIELDGHSLRAVRLDGRGGRPVRTLEVPWNPDAPAEAVQALRESFGRSRRVAVALRFPLLFAKRVRLPPMPAAERRKALRLEPQRYFPVRLEDLVVAVREDDLVFAAREDHIGAWTRALEALGPVERVEPGAVALARALGTAGIRDAVVALDDRERGTGLVDLQAGGVSGVRRLYGPPTEVAEAVAGDERPRYLSPWTEQRAAEWGAALPAMTKLAPLPDVAVPEPFLTAYGAALSTKGSLDETLLPDEQRARLVARSRRRLAVAVLATGVAGAFLLSSLDAWRARTADRLTAEIAALEPKAEPALALQEQLALLDGRARRVLQAAAERPDPLRVLLTVTERLPAGAYLRALRFAGGEWQVEGFAPRAAEVTQALGAAPELADVRVLGATSRTRAGEGANESFALAFRLAERP
ncbi:MAG TPA: PilN domain-containing protein [Gemmatimonadales bacterium]|nr:PilN domain-containing protein [Gemmatimonadales bacterium]